MTSKGARKRPKVERAVSAGGVVLRQEGEPEVVICGRDADGVWGLPKGTPDGGESLEEAAVREVREETGLEVEIVDKAGVVEYWFSHEGVRYHKWVHYYLMRATGGRTEDHDHEYDQVVWLPADEAMKKLTFDNDREMVTKAQTLARSGK